MSAIQPTASKTGLLLQCPRPFHPSIEIERSESGEAALYGNGFHALMFALKFGRELPAPWGSGAEYEPMRVHAAEAFNVLNEWLESSPWGPLTVLEGETARAYNAKSNLMRLAQFEPANHYYHILPGEVGGTADLIARAPDGPLVVLDYKTGTYGDFGAPASILQMLTLGVMFATTKVAILSAPRGMPVSIHAEEITVEAWHAHRESLVRALDLVELSNSGGEAIMRPGPECGHCPAKQDCPAQQGAAVSSAMAIAHRLTGAPLIPLEVSNPGALHQLITQFQSLAEPTLKRLRERALAGEIIERPDKKVLTVTTSTVESLSKKSITDALGKEAGAAEIERLRALGAVTVSERKEVRAK